MFDVLAHDKYVAEKSNSTSDEIVQKCHVIFACVPTPVVMNTGEASVGIVTDVVRNIMILLEDMKRRLSML